MKMKLTKREQMAYSTIARLEVERDHLKAEVEALGAAKRTVECRLEVGEDTLATIRGCLRSAEGDIDRLKAENEALKSPETGYAGAFYEVCHLVGVVNASPESPATVFKGQVVPALEALRKDAERYRWLKLQRSKVWREAAGVPMNHTDAFIDDAMAKAVSHD